MKENLEVMVDERTKQLRIYETIVENTDEAIYITDAKANIIKVNNAFEQITGYSESEVLKKSSKMLQSGKHSKSFYKKMWDSIVENGSWSGEIWDKKEGRDCLPSDTDSQQCCQRQWRRPLLYRYFP